MYITVHQVQLPERGHRAAAPVHQVSDVLMYCSTSCTAVQPGLWEDHAIDLDAAFP